MKLFGKSKNDGEDIYFKQLSEKYHLPQSPEEIYAALNSTGLWEGTEEWRISTWTDFKITKVNKGHEVWFRVEVKCDHDFTCHCPTEVRAVQMANLYHAVIMKMFYQLGWPSWISLTEHPSKRT
jgi:hypothetical protein